MRDILWMFLLLHFQSAWCWSQDGMARMSSSCKPFWDWGFSSVGRMFAWHKELVSVIEAVIFVDIKSIMLFSCPLQVYKLGTSFQILGFGFQSHTVCPLRILNILCVEQAECGSQKESLFWAGTQNRVESGPPGCLGTILSESEGNGEESVWRCVSKTLCSLERKSLLKGRIQGKGN